MLYFNDGVSIDTSGEYRTLRLRDGWYVVGHGMLMPCRDEAAAKAEIKLLTTPIKDFANGNYPQGALGEYDE